MTLIVCFLCEFHTSHCYAWGAHMRGHIDKATNQRKRKAIADEATSGSIPEGKRQKLEEPKVEMHPRCLIPGCPAPEGVAIYPFPVRRSDEAKEWLKRINSDSTRLKSKRLKKKAKALICALHFSPFSNAADLLPDAKPSVFPWSPGWDPHRIIESLPRKEAPSAQEKDNGLIPVKPEPPESTVTHTEEVPPSPPVDPSPPTDDEKSQAFKEEADLKQQLDQLKQAMVDDFKAIRTLLRTKPAVRLNMLRRKMEGLQKEGGNCRTQMADVTAKKEAVRIRSLELSARKEKVEIAVNLMLEPTPSIPGVKVEIPEDVNPVLERFLGELDALEIKIQAIRTEEEELQKSFVQWKLRFSANQRNQLVTRKKLLSAAIAVEDPSLSQRLQELVEGQRERIQSYADIEKQLVDVVLKRRLLLLDDFASFKMDV